MSVEEILKLLPLHVSNDIDSSEYNLSIFRDSDGSFISTYEDFDSGNILYQTIDNDLKESLYKMYIYFTDN